MSQNIVPVTVSHYNDTNYPIDLKLYPPINKDFIQNSEEYEVTVRSLEIPINTRFMPLNSSTGSYQVTILNMYKPEDRVIPGLEYGLNNFSINGPIYSVNGFIDQLNDIVFKKAYPVQLGFFYLDQDNMIHYQYDSQFANEHDMIKIYFDNKLQRLFPFDFDPSDSVWGSMQRFKAVTSYAPSPQGVVRIVTINANSFSYPKFYNLKAIRIRTSLPITHHSVSSSNDKVSDDSKVLLDIKYNSMQMYNNDNLLYTPATVVYSSMTSVSNLRTFDLTFYYYYADGTELPVKLDSLDYASAFIQFIKK